MDAQPSGSRASDAGCDSRPSTGGRSNGLSGADSSNPAPQARPAIVRTLSYRQQDTDLAGIRDNAALDQLPAEEPKAFTQEVADVAALLKKAGGEAALATVSRGAVGCSPGGRPDRGWHANGPGLPGREAGVEPGPARAVIARAGFSRLKPSPRPPASPGQSGVFSVLSQNLWTQIMIINRVMLLEDMRLAEGMNNPG